MQQFIKKYYIQLIIIVGFFLLIIFMIMESQTILTMIKEKSVTLKEIQFDRILASEFLQDVHTFKKNSIYIDQNIDTFNVLLPNNDDAKVRLFSELERIAKDAGNSSAVLAVNKIEPAAQTKSVKTDAAVESKEEYLSMKVTLIGTYNDLFTFVHKIENMQYFSSITSLVITKTEDTAGNAQKVDDLLEENTVRKDLIKTEMNMNFYLDNK